MTATEMQEILEKDCLLQMEKMQVRCIIRDVRVSFGREEVLVTPIGGDGQQWVNFDRVSIVA
jgi:hypothetical protein